MRRLPPCLLLVAACSTEPVRPVPPLPTPPPSATPETAAPPRRVITSPEAAQRLARAIASDILLYNDEAVRVARATGVVPASLANEIEEGRGLFRSRVSPEHEPLYQPAIDEVVLQKGSPRGG